MKNNSGIYKITSPSGRIYIGQTFYLDRRKRTYSYKQCKSQHRLYNSIEKYGWDAHIFEVIEYCERDLLTLRERHWQEIYDVTGPGGLNCFLTKTDEKPRVLSQETKDKIGRSSKGRIQSPEAREKNRISNTGKKHTPESIEKMRLVKKGIKRTPEQIKKQADSLRGRPQTEQHKENVRLARIEKGYANDKPVLDTVTGQEFRSAKDAALFHNFNLGTLRRWLRGDAKNKSNLIYA